MTRTRRWIGVLLGLAVLAEVLGLGWALTKATQRFDTVLILLPILISFGLVLLKILIDHR